MASITNRTNGLYDDYSEFKNNLVVLTNGVDENVVITASGTAKNLGIGVPDVGTLSVTPSWGTGYTNVQFGTLNLVVTFWNGTLGEEFESNGCTVVSATIGGTPTQNLISLANIPVSTDTQVTARRIYWTDPSGTVYRLGHQIDDNTTTTASNLDITANTGQLLPYNRAVFPICKLNTVFNSRMVLANQSNNRILPPRRSSTTMTVDTGTSSTIFTDAALISYAGNAANLWVGYRIYWTGGANAGEVRTISAYNSSTGQVTMSVALPNTTTTGDTYEIHGLLNKSTLWFSDQYHYEGYADGSDPADSDISFINFDAGDGQEITGLATFTQERGDSSLGSLVVFKNRKTFFINGDLPGSRYLISDSVGCVAPRSIVEIEKRLYFLGNRMVYTIGPEGDIIPIGTPIEPTIDSLVDWQYAQNAQGVAYKDMYLLAVPTNGQYPDKLLVYCWKYGTWHIWDFDQNITAMNRVFAEDGSELLELALWDATNSFGEVVKLSGTHDDGSGSTFSVSSASVSGTPPIVTAAFSGSPGWTADGGTPWVAGTMTNRTVYVVSGTGAGETGHVTATTAANTVQISGLTTTPDATTVIAFGLVQYYFTSGDIPVGMHVGAYGRVYDLYLGLRNAATGDVLKIYQYEKLSDTSIRDTEYTLGTGLPLPENPNYLKATLDLRAQNVKFKVLSAKIGQDLKFRNFALGDEPKKKPN